MCIRDRLGARQQRDNALEGLLLPKGVSCSGECCGTDFVQRPYEVARVLNDEVLVDEAAAGGYKPVSYTHLDVYKRQGFGWTATRFALAAMLVELTTP